jgi:hypothetical protein
MTYGCSPDVPRLALPGTVLYHASRQSHHILAGQRRVRDSNPGGRSLALAVFKTAAIGH